MLHVCLLNSRSLQKKTLVVKHFTTETDNEILDIAETWLSKGSWDKAMINDLVPPGCKLHNIYCPRGEGGGVGMVFKKYFDLKRRQISKFSSFRYSEVFLKSKKCIGILIYHPPSSAETE